MDMIAQYWPLIVTLMGVGALAGFSAGLFGIGGGAVMVPALYYAFDVLGYSDDVLMKCAVATSAAIIIVNSMRSVASHHKKGAVEWSLLWPKNPLLSYALWIGAGSFIAANFLIKRISAEQLTLLFAVVAALVSLQFIFGRPEWKVRESVPGGLAPVSVGGGIGVLSSLMGIGGGSFTVPLMSMCGMPIQRAVATASGFGFAIAVPATIGYIMSGWNVPGRPEFSMGYVNVLGFSIVAAIAFLTIPAGANLAHKLSQKNLKRIFGICLLIVAMNMAREIVF